MDEIAKRRAEKNGDNRLWKPMDAIEDCRHTMESGEIEADQILIILVDKADEHGRRGITTFAANLTTPDRIALLNVELQYTIEKWRRGGV